MKLILLVFATLLCSALCQTGCDSFVSEKNCTSNTVSNVACVWCPTQQKCRPVAVGCNCTECPSTKPTLAGFCPDNNTPRPLECDKSTCTWKLGDISNCPIVDPLPPMCPDNKPQLQCLKSPCMGRTNPDAVNCTQNYCGDCTATCNNTEGVEVPCNKDAPPPVDCSVETNCAGTKPTVSCSNGVVVCASNPSYNASSSDSQVCAWVKYCPPTTLPTTCGDGDCKTQSVDVSALNCGGGVSATTVCKRIITSSTTVAGTVPTSQCVLTAICPTPTTPPITPTPTCQVGGVCGEMCVNSSLAPSLSTLDPAICKSNPSCAQNCSIRYRVDGSCKYSSEKGCIFAYDQGYADCLKGCLTGVMPQPPTYECTGGPCGCNYDKCYVCLRTFTTQDSSVSVTTQTCQDQQNGDACTKTGGAIVQSKPSFCAVPQNNSAIPENVQKVIDAVKNFNVDNLQAKVDALSSAVPEAKNFLIAVKLTLDPSVQSDKSVNVQVIVDITGTSDPSTVELQKFCNDIIIPAAKALAPSISVTSCKLEKVASTSNKRSLQQTGGGSYISTLQTGSASTNVPTPPTGSNGASGIQFVSFAVAMILALVALVI